METTRKQAKTLVEQQMKGLTPAADLKSTSHYGWCEIQELLEFIYKDTEVVLQDSEECV